MDRMTALPHYVDGMRGLGLSAGVIEYDDTGGDGPVAVLPHGVAMGGSPGDEVVARPWGTGCGASLLGWGACSDEVTVPPPHPSTTPGEPMIDAASRRNGETL